MNRRILVGLTLLIIVPALVGYFKWRSFKHLKVQGRPIVEWAMALNGPQDVQQAELVIRETGTAAVPSLIHALEARDSLLKKPFLAIAPRLPDIVSVRLYRWLNPYEKERLRLGATRALELIGPGAEKAIPALGKALRDPSAEIAMHAAFALGNLGAPAVSTLINGLGAPRDETRFFAIQGLSRAGTEARPAIPDLIGVLRGTNSRNAREAAACLGRIGGVGAVRAATGLLRNPDLRIQLRGIQSLSALGPQARSAVPTLLEFARTDDPEVRKTVIGALGRIEPANPEVGALFISALQDNDPEVRAMAAEGLERGDVTEATSLNALIESLNDPDSGVRRTSLRVIASATSRNADLTAAGAMPAFVQALGDSDFLVRLYAAQALASLGPRAMPALGPLQQALNDPHPGVQSWAALALGSLGPGAEPARGALEKLLKHPDKAVTRAARTALEQLRPSPATVPPD
ncbi:MAG: HEAT repeat domain-containing protein [Verrucomicrobia bacterium]|jgi:HEAT repeat protein|nr:HEAT repeat domain-containing protein [Verrucomicrobiota bacterium]